MGFLSSIAGAALGGILGGGGGGSQNVTQVSEPWKPIQPALLDFSRGLFGTYDDQGNLETPGLFQNWQPQMYPGPMVAPFTPPQLEGQHRIAGHVRTSQLPGEVSRTSGNLLRGAIPGAAPYVSNIDPRGLPVGAGFGQPGASFQPPISLGTLGGSMAGGGWMQDAPHLNMLMQRQGIPQLGLGRMGGMMPQYMSRGPATNAARMGNLDASYPTRGGVEGFGSGAGMMGGPQQGGFGPPSGPVPQGTIPGKGTGIKSSGPKGDQFAKSGIRSPAGMTQKQRQASLAPTGAMTIDQARQFKADIARGAEGYGQFAGQVSAPMKWYLSDLADLATRAGLNREFEPGRKAEYAKYIKRRAQDAGVSMDKLKSDVSRLGFKGLI